MKNISIYVHIPFCRQKCNYCDFCSFCATRDEVVEYFEVLAKEIESKSEAFREYTVRTIYFGGGTPSSVESKKITTILELIKEKYHIASDAEITIECNPCTLDEEKLWAYKKAGFNRISFGVQSLNDKVLKAIGRLHTAEQAVEAIQMAQKIGFNKISCDLMLGLPEQTEFSILRDANKLARLGVGHISCYMLQLEEGTPLYEKVQKGEVEVADDDEQVRLYDLLVGQLCDLGYEQYEVSNFAKNKAFSRHNLNYWRRGEYLGFGLSAHSFVDETRFANPTSFEEYKEGKIAYQELLSPQEIAEEIVMLGLRYYEGVNIKKWKQNDFRVAEKLKNNKYLDDGILMLDFGRLKLDPKYYSINNEIISSLFD